MNLTDIEKTDDNAAMTAVGATIYVCMTCRRSGEPDDAPRMGPALAAATVSAAGNTGIKVHPLKCLANCKRGCSAVVRRDGAWTYIFGFLDAATDGPALIEGARLLAHSTDGLMPWRGRPDCLKRGLIARVPPLDFVGEGS